jgi:hypothetical protein
MYDAPLITCDCEIYCEGPKLYKVPYSFIALITIYTHSLCYSNIIGDPQNPRRSRRFQNLLPILGGVPSLSNSLTQPSHTPMRATILGSTLIGSNLLGSNSQGHRSTISPSKGGGGETSSQGISTTPPNPPQGLGTQHTHTMAGTNPPPPLHMPYLASLNIPYLSKLTNNPILHDPTWPAMPTKLPSYIPKFEGKSGEDPANHVMTFHLCFSSKKIVVLLICLV